MNLNNYATIISLIISVLVTINTFSKLEKSNKLSEDYFEKVITLYVKEYKSNSSINPVDFIKQKFDIKDYFIPSYIFYLVDKGEKEKLHDILLVDYREKYPNKQNNIFKGLDNIGVIFKYILVFVYIASIAIVSIFGVTLFIVLIKDMVFYQTIDSDNIICIAIVLLSLIIGIITIIIFKITMHDDDYVMQNKEIEKVIKRKEKEFKKYNDIYYIK